MPPFIKFILRRLFFVLLSFLIVTAVVYAGVMLTPPEERAILFLPKNTSPRMTEEQKQKMIERIIEKQKLNAPYPVQYFSWLKNLMQGVWGYSPSLHEDVLDGLLRRTPATVELTLYSFLVFFPLGVITGVVAARNQYKRKDRILQASAFAATAMPTFILALFLISIFYVGLRWFPPGRVGQSLSFVIQEEGFHQVTGLLTIDGLLNGRPDITLDALRHLVLPVITLSLFHWATLQRITRATMLDEFNKEYFLAVHARGISNQRAVWRHALKNALSPILTSTMLSAASLLTGVFVVEIIYNFHGISGVITRATQGIPDAAAAVGFVVYSVLVVLSMMFILDIIQAWLDPQYREGLLEL